MTEEVILRETLKATDSAIAKKEADIKRGEALERLKQNPDYQLIIEQGYIESESKKLFDTLTDPSGASVYTAEQIHLKLEAISHFKSYVGTDDYIGEIKAAADAAPEAIERERLYRQEVTAEYSLLENEEV
jgi:hypothetical protein